MTQYVCTRWFRAPELLLNFKEYDFAVDMWSVGCIMAQMLTDGAPLFRGKNYIDTLQQQIGFLGKPSPADMLYVTNRRARRWLDGQPEHGGVDFAAHFAGSGVDGEGLDLLRRLLAFDPSQRITSADALVHPWFDDVRAEGLMAPAPTPFSLEGIDESCLDADAVRTLLAAEVTLAAASTQKADAAALTICIDDEWAAPRCTFGDPAGSGGDTTLEEAEEAELGTELVYEAAAPTINGATERLPIDGGDHSGRRVSPEDLGSDFADSDDERDEIRVQAADNLRRSPSAKCLAWSRQRCARSPAAGITSAVFS